jgi:hypothetical protein
MALLRKKFRPNRENGIFSVFADNFIHSEKIFFGVVPRLTRRRSLQG